MSDFSITYTLTADEYSSASVRAGIALKGDGRAKSIRVGLTEIAIAVFGSFFVTSAKPLYAVLIGVCFLMGVYSLSFYQFIFPNIIKKKTYDSFIKSASKDNAITITLEPLQISSTVAQSNTVVSYDKLTAIISPTEVVLTSPAWSAVIPKSSVNGDFENLLEELSAKPLAYVIKI